MNSGRTGHREAGFAFDKELDAEVEVRVIRANGTKGHRIALHGWGPAWSPNRRRVVFSTGDPFRSQHDDLVTVRRNGRGKERIAKTKAPEYSVDWSSRDLLVFTRGFGRHAEIWVMRPDGSHQRRLTHNKVFDGSADWSPSGRRIVFTRVKRDRSRIFTMRRNGSHKRRIGRGSDPVWSPDGRLIAFVRSGRAAIFVMRRNGRNARVLVKTRLVYVDPDTGEEFPLDFGPFSLAWRSVPSGD